MSETSDMDRGAAQRVAVGSQVRAAREAMGLSQKSAADRIGVSNRTLSNIENGIPGQAAKLKVVLDYFNLHAVARGDAFDVGPSRGDARGPCAWGDARHVCSPAALVTRPLRFGA